MAYTRVSTNQYNTMSFSAQTIRVMNKALNTTPRVAPTPATSCATPAVPAQFKPRHLIDRDSDEYARLRHRAEAINAAKLDERPADYTKWRKSALTDHELFYLWNSQGGACGNCRAPLDRKTTTIEHIAPKSLVPVGTWDLRNLTVLCRTCNSKKGDRHIPSGMGYTASLAPSGLMTAARR